MNSKETIAAVPGLESAPADVPEIRRIPIDVAHDDKAQKIIVRQEESIDAARAKVANAHDEMADREAALAYNAENLPDPNDLRVNHPEKTSLGTPPPEAPPLPPEITGAR